MVALGELSESKDEPDRMGSRLRAMDRQTAQGKKGHKGMIELPVEATGFERDAEIPL